MQHPAGGLAPRPQHVPPDLVRDFDFNTPAGDEGDIHLAFKRLHETAPDIFWTPRNGGHWVTTRAADIKAIQLDHDRFSKRFHMIPPDPNAPKLIPVSLDPPEHAPYRKIIMPAFLPRQIEKLTQAAREVSDDLLDEIAPRGECEFIADFAARLPVAVFLRMVDLPMSDRDMLVALAEETMRGPEPDSNTKGLFKMMDYLGKWIEQRREAPGEDLISTVVHAKVGDRPIRQDEILSLLTVLLFGGLDTVTSLLSLICRFLAMNPGHCRELREHPELRRNAIEELMRRHGVTNSPRYITEDCSHLGVAFKEGDLILVPNMLFGLDDRVNADPLTVDFRRDQPDHAMFGNGPHTCPGAVLARRELGVFLDCWLSRIPEFKVKPGSTPQMSAGAVCAITKLELVWEPAATATAQP